MELGEKKEEASSLEDKVEKKTKLGASFILQSGPITSERANDTTPSILFASRASRINLDQHGQGTPCYYRGRNGQIVSE